MTKPKVGRPDKLKPETVAAIVDLLKAGAMIDSACESVGIGKTTFYRWISRGEAEGVGPFWEFRANVKKALADAENALVAGIREAGRTNWTANAWLLERRWPAKWGRNAKPDTKPSHGGAMPQVRAKGGG